MQNTTTKTYTGQSIRKLYY